MTLKEEAVLVRGIEDATAELLVAAPCPTFAAVPRLPSGASIPT
jgi:hypothetical protein